MKMNNEMIIFNDCKGEAELSRNLASQGIRIHTPAGIKSKMIKT